MTKVLLIALCLLEFKWTVTSVLICNANTHLNREFIQKVYNQYPVSRDKDCDNRAEHKVQFAAMLGTCTSQIPIPPLYAACIAPTMDWHFKYIERCDALENRLYEYPHNF